MKVFTISMDMISCNDSDDALEKIWDDVERLYKSGLNYSDPLFYSLDKDRDNLESYERALTGFQLRFQGMMVEAGTQDPVLVHVATKAEGIIGTYAVFN